jgi:DNA modification methylase
VNEKKYLLDFGNRGFYDKRNKLNDLTGKEWLQRLKSVWISQRCSEDKPAFKHPAPFLIEDMRKLITLFTKENQIVLDCFMGSGSTLVACAKDNRIGIGIELNKKYIKLAKSRLKEYNKKHFKIIFGDALKEVPKLETKIDYFITSPPYHDILKNNGQGLRHDGSQKRQGVEYYSEDLRDVGNQKTYDDYLELMKKIMKEVYRKLRKERYATIVVSDFTVKKKETNAHGDMIKLMQEIGFEFVGNIILVQDSKPLYPFGYPYAFKINHVHQYLINFRKNE